MIFLLWFKSILTVKRLKPVQNIKNFIITDDVVSQLYVFGLVVSASSFTAMIKLIKPWIKQKQAPGKNYFSRSFKIKIQNTDIV